jgi:hypothetical protein
LRELESIFVRFQFPTITQKKLCFQAEACFKSTGGREIKNHTLVLLAQHANNNSESLRTRKKDQLFY